MTRQIYGYSLLILLSFLVTKIWAQGEDRLLEIAKALPARTFFLAGVPSPEKTFQAFQEKGVGRIFTEPAVQDCLEASFEKFLKQEPNFPFDWEKLKLLLSFPSLLNQGMYLAFVLNSEDPKKDPSALMIFQSSESALIEKLITTLETWVVGDFMPEVRHSTQNGITLKEIGLTYNRYYYCLAGTHFVAGTNRDLVASVAENLQQKKSSETTLSTDNGFLKASEKVKRDGQELFFGYVDFEKVVRAVFPLNRRRSQDWMIAKILGAEKVQTLSACIRKGAKGFEDQIVLRYKDQSEWIGSLLMNEANTFRAADICPANTSVFASLKLSPAQLAKFVVDVIDKEQGGRGGRGGMLGSFQESFQFSLIDDFLGLLGDELSFYGALPQYGLLPNMAIMIPLKNPEKFFEKLQILLSVQNEFEFKNVDYLNYRIFYLTPRYSSFFPIIPSFTYIDNHLVLSYGVPPLKNLVKLKQKGEASLTASDAWFEALEHFPGKHQGALFVNTRQVVTAIYEIFYQLMSILPSREVPFDTMSLPDTETITQHLSTSMTFLDYSPEALTVTSFGDGISPGSLSLGAFELFFFVAFVEIRSEIERIPQSALWQLDNFYYALRVADDSGTEQWTTKTLVQLRQEGNIGQIVSPFDREAVSSDPNYTSYEYFVEKHGLIPPVGDRWNSDEPAYYLLYDKKPYYQGKRCVLDTKGVSRLVLEEDFQKTLQNQIQTLQK